MVFNAGSMVRVDGRLLVPKVNPFVHFLPLYISLSHTSQWNVLTFFGCSSTNIEISPSIRNTYVRQYISFIYYAFFTHPLKDLSNMHACTDIHFSLWKIQNNRPITEPSSSAAAVNVHLLFLCKRVCLGLISSMVDGSGKTLFCRALR